jgi:hypothetical protein
VRLPLATRFGRMLDYLDAPSKMILDPRLASARLSLIYPQMLKARELFGRPLQHQRHRCTILQVRRVHPSFEHHTQRIYQQMPLSAAELLRPIVTPNTAYAGGLHRLGVEDASAGLGIATSAHADPFAQNRVDLLPDALQTPYSEVIDVRWTTEGTRVEACATGSRSSRGRRRRLGSSSSATCAGVLQA